MKDTSDGELKRRQSKEFNFGIPYLLVSNLFIHFVSSPTGACPKEGKATCYAPGVRPHTPSPNCALAFQNLDSIPDESCQSNPSNRYFSILSYDSDDLVDEIADPSSSR